MKILVGYKDCEVGRSTLFHARDFAQCHDAFVHIITSMEGGRLEKQSDVVAAEKSLDFAKHLIEKAGLGCKAQQIAKGHTPGEDIVEFAREMEIDHIFLGIKKRSPAQMANLGFISRYVITESSCPITLVKFDFNILSDRELLQEKKILVVDDEPDVLETVEEILDICSIDIASSFEEAKSLLTENSYDLTILDIMGVNGYAILSIAQEKNIPALMLTAHALTPGNLKESITRGADAYIPKDELNNLITHGADVLRTRLRGKRGHGDWFNKLKPFFDKTFGRGWRDSDRYFWNSFDDKYGMKA